MATHSSVLAWRIPGMVEPGGLPSMGSHRIGHNWSDLAAAVVRFVIVFLPRSKCLLILWLQSPSTVILKSKKIKSVSTFFPSIYHEMMEPNAVILVFECWVLNQLFHSSFTLIKRLFSSSSLSAIRVVSSAYLRLLIFLLEILILAFASSSLAFCMMYFCI